MAPVFADDDDDLASIIVSKIKVPVVKPTAKAQPATEPAAKTVVVDPATPIELAKKSVPKVKKTNGSFDYPADFDEVYERYPRKVGKSAAFAKWQNLPANVKEMVSFGVDYYAADCKKDQTPENMVAHMVTWLSQARWENYSSHIQDKISPDMRRAPPKPMPSYHRETATQYVGLTDDERAQIQSIMRDMILSVKADSDAVKKAAREAGLSREQVQELSVEAQEVAAQARLAAWRHLLDTRRDPRTPDEKTFMTQAQRLVTGPWGIQLARNGWSNLNIFGTFSDGEFLSKRFDCGGLVYQLAFPSTLKFIPSVAAVARDVISLRIGNRIGSIQRFSGIASHKVEATEFWHWFGAANA